MNEEQVSLKSPKFRLDLSEIQRTREQSLQYYPHQFEDSSNHFLFKQKRQPEEPELDLKRKTISLSPTRHYNIMYDKTLSAQHPYGNQNQNITLPAGQMECFKENQKKNTRGQLKNHKHFRDLNNSLANLASKRLTGRSSSDNEANQDMTSPELLKNKFGIKTQNENTASSQTTLHGTKVPTFFQKYASRRVGSPEIQSAKDAQTLKEHEAGHKLSNLDLMSVTSEKIGRNRPSNESRYVTENQALKSSKHKQGKNFNPITTHQHNPSKDSILSSNTRALHVKKEIHIKNLGGDSAGLAEMNYSRHGMRDLTRHFDEGSLSSIHSIRNPAESRISGIMDEFRVEDLPNFAYHSRNNLSSVQNASKKSGTKQATPEKPSSRNPTLPNSFRGQYQSGLKITRATLITPTFKADAWRPSYIIYDMHDIISRHTKESLDQRRTVVEMEESKGRRDDNKSDLKPASFQGATDIKKNILNFESKDNSFDQIDKNHVSDGVEYRTGGVGVESSSTRKGRSDNLRMEDLEISLKEEALKIKSDMAKRRQDYEEVRQFIHLASREVQRSKRIPETYD